MVFSFSFIWPKSFWASIVRHESFTPRGKPPHPDQRAASLGFKNDAAYTDSLAEILAKVDQYEGLIIRSKYPIDEDFLARAKKLKFIGRVGSGLENIDVKAVESRNIHLINAPEGNRNAVGEHALGMLLSLMNRLKAGDAAIRSGRWDREGHRGWELSGRTVGIIGYGNTGKVSPKEYPALMSKPFATIFWTMWEINLLGKSVGKSCNLSAKSSALTFHKPDRPAE